MGVINHFIEENIFIVSVACQNDHIIVSGSDDKIYIYELIYPHSPQSTMWMVVVGIAAASFIVIFMISVCVILRKKRNR